MVRRLSSTIRPAYWVLEVDSWSEDNIYVTIKDALTLNPIGSSEGGEVDPEVFRVNVGSQTVTGAIKVIGPNLGYNLTITDGAQGMQLTLKEFSSGIKGINGQFVAPGVFNVPLQ